MRQDANAGDGHHRLCASISNCGIGGTHVYSDDVRAHGKDERTRVKDFHAGVKTLTLLLRDLAGHER
jgi:acetylornithine deacetylase/succinyl-diaminopimelate desuccinylase-like protein